MASETVESARTLYRSLLRSSYGDLPGAVQRFHNQCGSFSWSGQAEVRRGASPLAWLVATIMRFPPAGSDVPIRVEIDAKPDTEVWVRDFSGRRFRSTQTEAQGLLVERFGAVRVSLKLVQRQDRMFLVPQNWTCFGVALPKWLLPRGDSFETEAGGLFTFDVSIAAPIVGLIVAYRGTLSPD